MNNLIEEKTHASTAQDSQQRIHLANLGRLVNAYLDLVERQARRKIPMTMKDWAVRLDKFLEIDGSEILKNTTTIL